MNGRRLSIPSAQLRPGDVVGLTSRGKKAARIEGALDGIDARGLPGWLTLNKEAQTGEITSQPAREELTLPIQEQLIVELYSRYCSWPTPAPCPPPRHEGERRLSEVLVDSHLRSAI